MFRYRVNRKKRSGPLLPAPFAAIVVMAGGMGLAYVWLCGRCEMISRQIQRLEAERAELRRRVVAEEYRWAQLNTLSRIRAALDRFGIVMERPDDRRIIRLARPLEPEEWEEVSAPRVVLQPGRLEFPVP